MEGRRNLISWPIDQRTMSEVVRLEQQVVVGESLKRCVFERG